MNMRLSLIVAALGFGAAASFVPGCLIPDYCFVTFHAGQDWCRKLDGALMWPAGQPDLAEPIFAEDQDLPKGCRCMNDTEQMVMMDQSPEAEYIDLVGELAIETRMQCAALVPEGYEHNCLTLDGPMASSLGDPFGGSKSNECIGSCSFGNPPPFGECPEPDPYTCNGEPKPGEDEVGTEDTGTDEGGVLSDLPRAP
jgi:hypothetical protein